MMIELKIIHAILFSRYCICHDKLIINLLHIMRGASERGNIQPICDDRAKLKLHYFYETQILICEQESFVILIINVYNRIFQQFSNNNDSGDTIDKIIFFKIFVGINLSQISHNLPQLP